MSTDDSSADDRSADGILPPAPLPPHERTWRHPSEVGAPAYQPPIRIWSVGRGVVATSIAFSVVLVVGLLVLVRPTDGRSDPLDFIRLSSADMEVARLTATEVDEPPMAIMVDDGPLLVTTKSAVGSSGTIQVRLTDGRIHLVSVVMIDDESSIAVLAMPNDEPRPPYDLPLVREVRRGQEVVVLSDAPRSVRVELSEDGAMVLDPTDFDGDTDDIVEGAPVIDRAGRLIGLCTHVGDDVVIVPTGSIAEVLDTMVEGR